MRAIIFATLVTLFITSCVSVIDDGALVCLGMSQEEISSKFKGPGTFQFAAHKDSAVFHCVGYSFNENYLNYYFLFKNGKLVSIIDVRAFTADAFETIPDPMNPGTKIEARKLWNDEDCMTSILKTETMSPEVFYAQVKSKTRPSEKADHFMTIDNALPAFVILSPILIPYMMTLTARYKIYEITYDPFKIDIGAKRINVETIYGKPTYIVQHKDSNRTTHAYGPTGSPWNGNGEFWIAVVYENDDAVRIFSNSMFNYKNIMRLENEVK
jgi:hypothetical protein